MNMTLSTIPEIKIIQDCPARDKDELFASLAKSATDLNYVREAKLTSREIEESLWERERESSTEVGCGLIFPHARLSSINGLSILLAVLNPSGSHESTAHLQLACMMLIPETAPMKALKFMSRMAACMHDPECREHLLHALRKGNLEQLQALIALDSKKILCATDLMQSSPCLLSADLPLKEATKRMRAQTVQTAPVLEGDRLVGELSCDTLFKLGIPDFFTQLKSVGFIRFFDPFEKYFAVEAQATVAGVMTRDVPKFTPEATLIEIVFAMVVSQVPLIYIVDHDNRLLGVIDKSILLERIINL